VLQIIEDDKERFVKLFQKVYRDIIRHFGAKTYQDIQSRIKSVGATETKAFDFTTDDILTYISETSAEKVVLISETTKTDIKNIIIDSMAEGASILTMTESLDKLYLDKIIPNRSRTIARTEVVSASNFGSLAGAQQTTPKLRKVWIPTFDDSTRDSHRAMANHPPIKLNESFDVNGSRGRYPADFSLPAKESINCRCAVGYEYAEETQSTINEEQQIFEQPKTTPNPLLPDEIAGVKRGNPMTRNEANHAKANPKFGTNNGYKINCQACVVTYEARLRGYDVRSLPNTKGSKLEELSKQTNLAWIDTKTGKPPEYIFSSETTNDKKFLKFMEDNIKENERYTLEFSWGGRERSGHIISLDRDENGKLRLYDPQSAKTYTGNQIQLYLKKIKYVITVYGNKIPVVPKILRIDDKQFNLDFANNIMESALE